ncbi:hypothetical protein EK0264_08315 [Epidermidibacterium keratini]|uniref:Uncharacterized protein n=1 Tax=Epidermidibacterium keratini TaxID=1891644 RepID=A0A7L4YN21_9ACTN|nr:hypothetical protein [Epidermidibacterium keratini]QHC00283.1 hypothetical protein EK0264_08315 [Epidermidibacterium keratini]
MAEHENPDVTAVPPVQAADSSIGSPAGAEAGAELDGAAAPTLLAEVLPGVAVVFGDVPDELRADLVGLGLVSEFDRLQLANALAVVGSAASIAGNLGVAAQSAKGLYRLTSETQALLNAGGRLAVKDGANLGTVITSKGLAQARFVPASALTTASVAAAIGSAAAAIAMQLQLAEIGRLVQTNIALTTQVLTVARRGQWAELTGLVSAIDRAVLRAQEIGSVPSSLWGSVAGKEPDLRAQLDLYRQHVRGHTAHIDSDNARRRREYLQTNAEAILFDTYALLSSAKAWTGYQALHAGMARASGENNPEEERLVEVIARDTGIELNAALDEARELVGSLTLVLRMIAELPGRGGWTDSITRKRGDTKSAREEAARLLAALEPLAESLLRPRPPLEPPSIVCAPSSTDLTAHLRILRWILADDETLRAIAMPDRNEGQGPLSSVVGDAMDKLSLLLDRYGTRTLVVVTDRRIITADIEEFLERGQIHREVPLAHVRYVRSAPSQKSGKPSVVDLITRDENIRWHLPSSTDVDQLESFAGILAESITIPESERKPLRQVQSRSQDVTPRD